MTPRCSVILSFALVAFAAGCSSSSTPGASDAAADGKGGGDAPQVTVTFDQFYSGVIKDYKCLDCHVPGGEGVSTVGDGGEMIMGGELDMSTPELAYKNLVNVKAAGVACGKSGLTRVVPNDPDASLILQKTELALTTKEADAGEIAAPIPAPCGSEMPLGCSQPAVKGGLACLFTGDIKTLTGWINSGAPGP